MTRISNNSSQPPSGLVDVLNPPEDRRDSAYFSSSSNGEGSKHTSMASNNQVFSPASSGYQSSLADKTPSPTTTLHVQPLISPTSTGMPIHAMVSPLSPTTPHSVDSDMLAKLRPTSSFDGSQRTSVISNGDTLLSRRESVQSVDSRMQNGFESMKLNPSSPYASNNQSSTSLQSTLQSTLQQQRHPAFGGDRLSGSRYPNTYSPHAARFSGDPSRHERTAPTITGPVNRALANAEEPAPGEAWAFPDDGMLPTSNGHSSRPGSYKDSRRSSIADSLASSQYTTGSRLPLGQRRLDESYDNEYHRRSRASSEFQGVSHHHHSLQHKQVGELRDEEGGSPGSTQPYSRTPELRVSHKLAERKRRNEMKELYDELRDLMPQERGSKASKWEILQKAISEHKQAQKMIQNLTARNNQYEAEINDNRNQMESLRAEMRDLQTSFRKLTTSHLTHSGPPQAAQPSRMEGYAPALYGDHTRQEHRSVLPSINTLNAPLPVHPGEGMTGVQYQHMAPSHDTYRQPYPGR